MFQIIVYANGKKRELSASAGKNIAELLAENGYRFSSPCGGRGVCRKCRARLISGSVAGVTPGNDGRFLTCKASVDGTCAIEVYEAAGGGVTAAFGQKIPLTDGEEGYGVALDIGTTTLAAYLVELSTGREVAVKSCLNPQCAMGADVMTRIQRAASGGLGALQKLLLQAAEGLLQAFKGENRVSSIRRLCVCGNTTMLHLFAGVNPAGMGGYPFSPAFTEERRYEGEELGLSCGSVVLLAGSSAFIGSDITAGLLACDMERAPGNALLLDLGTNGETVLKAGGKLYACSMAAGPAFEGANISCGMGGVPGAISRVRYCAGDIVCTTVGGEPKGICGSGLIDLIAVLLGQGVISATGAFTAYHEVKSRALAERLAGELYIVTENVTLSQRDVREVQLAKSAIFSGIGALLAYADLTVTDIDTVFLAGGFGFYLDASSAVAVGLIPSEFAQKVKAAGNTGGAGAKLCLVSGAMRDKCAKLGSVLIPVELASNPVFNELFVQNLNFLTQV